MILSVALLLVSIVALWFGADWLVDSAARIARRLGISELVIGLTVVALGTSAEFAVTVQAALAGEAAISVGNVVGSNVFNVCFILGLVALVRAVRCSKPLVLRDGAMMIGSCVALALFAQDGELSRGEGIVFLVGLFAYVTFLIVRKPPLEEEPPCGPVRWFDPFRVLGGLATVVVGGRLLVDAATDLARAWGISEWAIGVTIVAAGTSMPEMATSVVAIVRGRYGISAGNLIGSNIFNILGVLGAAAALRPLALGTSMQSSIGMLVALMVLVVVMMRTGWRISRVEGGLLLAINVMVWLVTFGVLSLGGGSPRQAIISDILVVAAALVLLAGAVGGVWLTRARSVSLPAGPSVDGK